MNRYYGTPVSLISFGPGWPGQLGVPGSASDRGFRIAPQAVVLYVDGEHDDASDNNDGTDPEHPMETIQGAIDQVENKFPYETSKIRIAAGTYTETILISEDLPENCVIEAIQPGSVDIVPAAADEPTIQVRQAGWIFWGLIVYGPASAAAFSLEYSAADGHDASRVQIDNCWIDGDNAGLYGIDLVGAPLNIQIYDSVLRGFAQGDDSGAAITSSAAADQEVAGLVVDECYFVDNEQHITLDMIASRIIDNRFVLTGPNATAVTVINTDPTGATGDNNIVTGNLLPGDYSTAGEYDTGANDIWSGNIATDVAEAEVGDNGITIAAPAA